MPIKPPSAAPPSSAAADQSPAGSDSDEYEYEEVEIEEEVEVEEEVSDEEGEEGVEEEEESGADLSPPQIEIDHDKRERKERKVIDDGDMHYNNEARQCGSQMMSVETSNSFNVSGKQGTGESSMVEGINEANGLSCSQEEAKQTSVHDANDDQLNETRFSRSDVALIRCRSLTPGEETKEGDQRSARLCEFFAKGWCIKGNSCRFLHITDPIGASGLQQESPVAAANTISEMKEHEGLKEDAGRSKGLTGLATSAVAPDISDPSKMIQQQELMEGPKWRNEPEELQKKNPATITSSNDVKEERLRENSRLNNDNFLVNGDGSLHGALSSSPFVGSGIHQNNKISPYAMSSGGIDGKRNQFGHQDVAMPSLSYSINLSSSSAQLTNRVSPLKHNSGWTRTSSMFSSSSSYSDCFGTLKHLDGEREVHVPSSASLQPSVSPFSGSESEHLSRTNVSSDPLFSAISVTKFSPYDWEPSKPFRSAFLLSRGLCPGRQYDPIRDSIESANLGNGFFKFSSSGQGSSISAYPLTNVNLPLKRTYNDSHSLAIDDGGDDNRMAVNNGGYDLSASKTGSVDTVTDQENKMTAARENKIPKHAHVGDIAQASDIQVNHDFKLQKDGARKKDNKLDETRQNHKPDYDIQEDEAMNRVIKQFRAALIEFVKELLKPTWREGNLSKDAHRVIVKKSVEKVLGTLPAELIPSTQESVDKYLSSCQPKLAKLVEGYTEKYGKS